MSQRPRVLLLIPHLGGGGAERVTELLARHLSCEKYELHLGLVTQGEMDLSLFPPGITIHTIGAPRVRQTGFRLLRLIWQLRPQIVLSSMAHLNFLVLFLRPVFPLGTRVLVRQNGTLSSMLRSAVSPRISSLLYRFLYRRADGILCQSTAMATDLHNRAGIPRRLMAVLPNPIDFAAITSTTTRAPSRWSGPGPHLLAVGRLSHEKGFDLLLQAFALLKNQFPTADMAIAGRGPEESALRAQCHALALASAVQFAGYVETPAEFFPGATLFVLSSRHEGVPNALLEAAVAGLPLVATPASGGLTELLDHKSGVWMTRGASAESLAEALASACATLHPGDRFSHQWINRFRLEHAISAYEEQIDAALKKEQR